MVKKSSHATVPLMTRLLINWLVDWWMGGLVYWSFHAGDSSDSVLEEVVEEEHIVMQGVEEQQVGTIYEITLRQRWAQFQKFYSSFVK